MSCEEEKGKDLQKQGQGKDSFKELPQVAEGLMYRGVKLPKGSHVASERRVLMVELPKNISYLADFDGKVIELGDDRLECSCAESCRFGVSNGEIACGNCNSLDGCISNESSAPHIGSGQGGGLVDWAKGVDFVHESHPKEELSSPDWEVMRHHRKASEGFNAFFRELWPKGKAEVSQSKYALLSVYGKLVRIPVPNGRVDRSLAKAIIAAEGRYAVEILPTIDEIFPAK